MGKRGKAPLLLHLLAPTAPENADGTCSTRSEGMWNFERRNLLAIFGDLFSIKEVHGGEMGSESISGFHHRACACAYRQFVERA